MILKRKKKNIYQKRHHFKRHKQREKHSKLSILITCSNYQNMKQEMLMMYIWCQQTRNYNKYGGKLNQDHTIITIVFVVKKQVSQIQRSRLKSQYESIKLKKILSAMIICFRNQRAADICSNPGNAANQSEDEQHIRR